MPRKEPILQSKLSPEHSLAIVWPIVFAGGFLGLLLSWAALSGDQQGRVNLLYLLLVYLVVPIVSIVAALLSIFFGKGINLARLLSSIPFWSYDFQSRIRKIQQLNFDKFWFLMQSQAAAIAFSCASIFVFFILLLATDVNFVWRSTILNAADLFPWLKSIATPWLFWETAQPSLVLLEQTQDSRLATHVSGISTHASWWPFILATQLVYSLLLRLVLWFYAYLGCKCSIGRDIENKFQSEILKHSYRPNEKTADCPILNQLPQYLTVNNWAGTPLALLARLTELDLSPEKMILAGPLASSSQQLAAERWQDNQVVIVKAWEPPMGELKDFLENGKGYLLPLDWNSNTLLKPSSRHIREWQRFVSYLENWQLYCPVNIE